MQLSARRSRSMRPLPYPVRFAVLGGGSFGLALASVLGKKSIPVTILVRKEEVAEHINLHHRHPTYLSDIALAPSIRATVHPEEALRDASFIIHAVPVQYSRKFLEDIAPHVPKNTPIISTSKVRIFRKLLLVDCHHFCSVSKCIKQGLTSCLWDMRAVVFSPFSFGANMRPSRRRAR